MAAPVILWVLLEILNTIHFYHKIKILYQLNLYTLRIVAFILNVVLWPSVQERRLQGTNSCFKIIYTYSN
jgi:hypothetical protein